MHGLVPPVYASASYARDPDGSYPGGHSYTRDRNPTFDAAEDLLRRLEGGAGAMLFASGMAAGATVLDVLPEGARIVAPREMYFTFRRFLERRAAAGRCRLALVPAGDLDALADAVREARTDLVWLETPTNPLGHVTDLAAASAIAHAAGALVAVDSTLATPANTRPIEHGADLILHSASKQLNGHADVVAGALVTAREDEGWAKLRFERGQRGAILGPFEAWLLLRGMKTLFVRVARSAENALRVAEALAAHPRVEAVAYPGLPGHPGHAVARRQMDVGFGPIVSFRTGGGSARARAVAARLEVFTDATSLGGTESVVEHRAGVEGAGTEVPDDLLRLSIGLEAAEDLIEDLAEALSA
jgi:cystathionine gamma-synthase